MNETLLISALVGGDAAAFRQLVTAYQARVYNTAISILQNAEDAEDITQEVFIQVFQSIHQFKEDAKLSTWLYRITVNKSLACIRKRQTQKRFGFLTSLLGTEDIPHSASETPFYHPNVALEGKELSAILFKAIYQLPDNQRIAFILHKIEQLSYQEIAEVMEVSVSSVESLMFRAKQNLQKYLGDFYEKYYR
jgi:RNA polymerase sigma-70 factor (ECF subfamily)